MKKAGCLAYGRSLSMQPHDRGSDMARKKLKEHRINREWCKGCGICVAFCPKTVLELDREDKALAVRIEDCIACRLCELRCPDLAIEVETENSEAQNSESGSQKTG
jgi:2-oxoglutarate ferredoxin oxidoreductase subunit delta